MPISVEDERLSMLAESMISLAVRSPMNREAAVSVAEYYRGPLPERERNTLIAVNMRHSHKEAVKQIGTRGKFVAIYSPARELIFGDGFYHNIRSPVNSMHSPKILAPLTPDIAVLFVRPMAYTTMPRFLTLVIDTDEAKNLNHAVQVYSRDKIYYRSEKPEVDDAYVQSKHLDICRADKSHRKTDQLRSPALKLVPILGSRDVTSAVPAGGSAHVNGLLGEGFRGSSVSCPACRSLLRLKPNRGH